MPKITVHGGPSIYTETVPNVVEVVPVAEPVLAAEPVPARVETTVPKSEDTGKVSRVDSETLDKRAPGPKTSTTSKPATPKQF
jgi:hypothetical protein